MEALAGLYSHDMIVWHNFDNRAQSREENIELLSHLPEMFHEFKYTNIRRHIIDDGFVQQHDLSLVKKDGTRNTVHVCMVVKLRHNHIVRIDEYFDTSQAAFPEVPAA